MNFTRRQRLSKLPSLAILVLTGFSLLSFVGMMMGVFSIFSHFQLYLAIAWLCATLLLALVSKLRRFFWHPNQVLFGGILLLLGHVAAISSLWLADPQPDLANPTELDIVWFNSHHQEAGIADLERMLQSDPPDVIALAEVGLGQRIDLPGFDYIWRSNRASGLMITSRYPIENERIESSVKGARDQLVVDIVVDRRRFKFVAVHFRKPYESEHRDEFLAVARIVAPVEHAIVAGDFNTTPWSAHFRQFCASADLRHARKGFGLQNSFGLSRWQIAPIPIDHLLYKGDIALTAFESLPWMHSDHRPVRGSFLLGMPRGRQAQGDF
ncbi:MAG: endonuclease/exonuclease/phosphatase family protein [Planctomycetota bacterium]|jgi:endonuclease/exonuclease/phosphatase (EEP) superfamily protein YafD|nr:endonuclease/exonuclease/phosphatase family protein [Planctomycetota bacterium]